MVIDKLAHFKDPRNKIFRQLQQAWQEQGFELIESQEMDGIIHCSGRSYSRVRVDVLTQCIEVQDETLVQMIYSPRLTPAISRPVNISPAGQEKIHLDLEVQMMAVLDKVGEWWPMTRENAEERGVVLSDPYLLQFPSNALARRLRMFVGLGMAVLGSIMGYLNLNGILALGSSGLWLVIAVAGVFLFCLGLFKWVWRR